jgi:nucleotide-binding universal stress UspA family protein
MDDFKKVLFPVDFSECSENAFPFALSVAKKYEARLYLIHVVRDLSHYKMMYIKPVMLDDVAVSLAEGAEKKMKEFCEKHLSDFDNFATKVVIGDADEEILNYADEKRVDLIIICTHGRKGLNRTLLGSVADSVIKGATIPVLSINPYRMELV